MTDEENTGPTLAQLEATENELGDLLAEFFATRGVPPAVGISVLVSLVGRGLHTFSSPEDVERCLAAIFKSIRYRATGDDQAADGPAH